MAKPQRLSKKVLQEDLDAYAALQAIPDYESSNDEFTLENITASKTTMNASQTVEVQKKGEYDGAKDTATDDERDFHNRILGAKTQVKGKYGVNSNEYQSLGMKKKEEYKKPKANKPSGGGNV